MSDNIGRDIFDGVFMIYLIDDLIQLIHYTIIKCGNQYPTKLVPNVPSFLIYFKVKEKVGGNVKINTSSESLLCYNGG